MSHSRLSVLVLFATVLSAAALAGQPAEKAAGAEKLRLISVGDAPDPFSPPAAEWLTISAEFAARPTDAGAGNTKSGKTFAICVTVNISREGEPVDTVYKEVTIEYPDGLPASEYLTVPCQLLWGGLDDASEPFPDGEYTYSVQGTLVRYDEIGKGETKEHVVATSAVLSGTVTVDSTPPPAPTLAPGQPATVRVDTGQETVTIAADVSADTETVKVDPLSPLKVQSVVRSDNSILVTIEDAELLAPGQTATVSISALDLAGNESAPLDVTVVANSLPVAVADADSALEDASVVIDVLANDTDADDDALTIVSVSTPGAGTALADEDGTVRYSPNDDWFGADSFTYQIEDGHGGSATGQVTVNVLPVNDPPSFTVGPDQEVLEDAGPQIIQDWATGISAGPSNEADQAVSFVVSTDNDALFASAPAISPEGTLTFTTALNANGNATVTLQAKDNGGTANGGSDTSPAVTFTITVTPVNDAPVTVADSYSLLEDGTLDVDAAGGVLANDTDVDGDALQAMVQTDVLHGTLSLAPDGSFVYEPEPDFFGQDSFTYVADDDNGGVSTGVVEIVVIPVNDPPSFTAGTAPDPVKDTDPKAIQGWATSISPGPENESGQAVTFVVTTDNDALFASVPSVSSDGTLTLEAAPEVSGDAVVTVVLQDDGGTENGGSNTSEAASFTITADTIPTEPWTPGEITTALWLDAADAGTITQSGGAVSHWADKSGNDNHAAQATGSRQPVYASSDGMLGDMPSVGTGGLAGKYFWTPTVGAKRIFAVLYFGNGTEAIWPEHCAWLSGPGRSGEWRITGRTNQSIWDASNDFNDAGTYRDGSTTSSRDALPLPATLWKFESSETRTQTWKILCGNSASWSRWNGALGELIFTDGTEDLDDQQKVEGYLAWKWGLEDGLPADHPYKSAAPVVGIQPEPGAFEFSAANYAETEGDSGSSTVTVVVRRIDGSDGVVSIDYATSDGSATVGDNDYVATSGTLIWADGDDTDKTFSVSLVGDTAPENDEILGLTLSNATGGATLGAVSTATVTITDDDVVSSDWTPSAISTELWLDASDYSTITESGGSVSQWADKSGSDNHATQATGSRQPVYASSDGMLGGMPSVGTGGLAGKYFWTPTVGAKRIYAVLYFGNGTEAIWPEHCAWLSGPGRSGEWRITGRTNQSIWDASNDFNDAGTYRDGSIVSSRDALPLPATLWKFESSQTRTQTWKILCGNSASWSRWNGALGELIFTDGAEDLATQQRLEGYLAWKWGLQGNLPADHPYKSAPPVIASGALQFTAVDISETEGDSGTKDVTVAVSRSGGTTGAVSVDYAASDGTATLADNDYFDAAGTLSWEDGNALDKTFTVTVNGDTDIEGDETVNLTLSNETGGATLGLDAATVTIRNDDVPGTLQFGETSFAELEGNSGTALVTVTVSRTGGVGGAASVDYATSDGTATLSDGDYEAVSGTLTWASGDGAEKTFEVVVIGDTTIEADETISLELSNAVGASLGTQSAVTVTIQNDDAPGTLQFSAADHTDIEGDSGNRLVTVLVKRTGGASGTVSVDYATSDGTATLDDDDYVATSGTLTWTDGDVGDRTFTVEINGDTDIEADEAINMELSNATGGAVLGLSGATVTIISDDRDPYSEPFVFTVKTDNVGTSGDNQFTLPLRSGEDYDFTVSFDGQQISHDTDSDLTLTFASGPGTYDVEILGDFPAIYFNDSGDKEKLLDIKAWGGMQWTSMESAFHNCSNMQLTATDIPDLTGVTDTSNMFMKCIGMTAVDVSYWNVSNVTDMTQLFRGCRNVTQITGLQTWDMRNVSKMSGMFFYCLQLQSVDVTGWQLLGGPSLSSLFYRCYNLTEIIGYETWDVSQVTSLQYTFERVAKASLDFSNWNTTGALTDVSRMLASASATEIKGLEGLNVTNVTNAFGMLTGNGLATSDYDALLMAWDQQSQLAVEFDAGSSMYSPFGAAQLARESLEAKGWRITDGGTVAGVNPIPESSIVSPVSVDGWFGEESFTMSVDGGAYQGVAEVGGAWYSNVALNPDAATSIEIKYGNDVVKSQSVTWTPTVIDTDSGQTVTIIRGNSLLLASEVTTGEDLLIDADGNGTFELSGDVGDMFPTAYDTAGTYSVTSRVGEVDVGWLTVEVVDVTFPDKVACQVGFTRDVTVVVARADAANIVFSATQSASMTVETVDIVNDVAHLRITPLTRGTPTVVARLGVGGPIIAAREVDEFTLDVPSRVGAIIDDDVDVGTSKLTMRPYVSHVRFDYNMFGSQSTFFGGAKFFSINTSHTESSIGEPGFQQVWDETTGETVGEFLFDLEVPDGEDMWCFNITANANPNGVPIGEEGGINGGGCKIKVNVIRFCTQDTDHKYLIVTLTAKGDDSDLPVDIEGSTGEGAEEGPQDDQAFFVNGTGPGKITFKPPVDCDEDVGTKWKIPTKGGSSVKDYDVKIDSTTFYYRIQVIEAGPTDFDPDRYLRDEDVAATITGCGFNSTSVPSTYHSGVTFSEYSTTNSTEMAVTIHVSDNADFGFGELTVTTDEIPSTLDEAFEIVSYKFDFDDNPVVTGYGLSSTGAVEPLMKISHGTMQPKGEAANVQIQSTDDDKADVSIIGRDAATGRVTFGVRGKDWTQGELDPDLTATLAGVECGRTKVKVVIPKTQSHSVGALNLIRTGSIIGPGAVSLHNKAERIVMITIKDQWGQDLASIYNGDNKVEEKFDPIIDQDDSGGFPAAGAWVLIIYPDRTLTDGKKEDECSGSRSHSFGGGPVGGEQPLIDMWMAGNLYFRADGSMTSNPAQGVNHLFIVDPPRDDYARAVQHIRVHGHVVTPTFTRTICWDVTKSYPGNIYDVEDK